MAVPLVSKEALFTSVARSMTKKQRLLVGNGIHLKKWDGSVGAYLSAALHFAQMSETLNLEYQGMVITACS